MRQPVLPAAARRNWRAFTLVELLVVLAIIALLASILLGALYASQEKARADNTAKTIAKLDALIRAQWDTYRTRRVMIASRGPSEDIRSFAARQLLARWGTQRAEMPDRYSDITTDGTTPTNVGLLAPSALQLAYIDAIDYSRQVFNAQNGTSDNRQEYLARIDDVNQSAECLYLTVTVGLNAQDEVQFTEAEVGDTDDDGMLEFLDGYGQPINFLRWAPGFQSDLQVRDPINAPDPFDPLGVGRELSGQSAIIKPSDGGPIDYGFKLYPLIYSVGPDGEGGLMLLGESVGANPYEFYDYKGTPYQRGAAMPAAETPEGGRFDNIHNHYAGER